MPIAVLGTWGIHAAIGEQRREMEDSMLNLSRALASAVDVELDAAVSAMRTMANSPLLAKKDFPSFYAVAREAARARPHWAGIVLTDGKGQLIFKSALPDGTSGAKIIESPSLEQAIATHQPVIGNIAKGQAGEYAVPVRYPVVRNGEVAYVLTAAVKPDRILEIINRQQVPKSWVISVQDASNLRVARSKDHQSTVATGISPTLAQLISTGKPEGAGVTRTLEGTEVITTYARIPKHGWMVVIGAPTAPINQVLQQSLTTYILVIGASLAICIGLAILLSRKIALGIGAVEQQALRLGQGEPISFKPHSIHEINQIGAALQAASNERRAAEEEREKLMASLSDALKQAEQAGQAKDEFLAVLGHELRNPLAPMVTALDLMDVKGNEAFRRERDVMRRQVAHMRRLVDDLLDVSRITKGKLEIRKEPVNLRTVVERAAESVFPLTATRDRGIAVSAVDSWVNGDETRLIQVVTNLLTNALRFDPKGEISVSLTQAGDGACISVRDEGAGMNPEMIEQVFKPFFQAPQSLARTSGGLGLGLAIVKSLVELHGGTVSASSPGLGKGCTFQVCLQTIAPPSPADEDRKPASQLDQHARIMVVDDNIDAAQAIAEMLKLNGHTVQAVHDSHVALEMIQDFAPELMFVDIGLPEMDGYELARTIRRRYASQRIKLVALTGYGQSADKSRASNAGFDRHLTKPAELNDLLSAVDLLKGS
ncbi:hybrid sensor histidine kinase/response regulator [Paucimonas lemoignei]|uniref:hybrid sensor histidine kinase/response regulator n=1 Tax=Paucimonas lemoignei TaxID=29443 RepID=UPI001FB246C0|nr:ATP-binding protein [Paucimonas lemoignei]